MTTQQANKYELGINRISAGRLFEIAHAMATPIDYFYEGFGKATPHEARPGERRVLEIARRFREISDPKHQAAISQLTRILAGR